MKNKIILNEDKWSKPMPYLDLATELHYEISYQNKWGELYFKILMVELGEEVIVPSTFLSIEKVRAKQ